MSRFRFASFALTCALAASLSVGVPATWAKSDRQSNQSIDVANFAKVSNMLYRGAQPSTAGFNSLKAMGVGIVVNFRDDRPSERQEVESLGMKYVEIPWSGSDYPSDKQVIQFLDLVRANPDTTIFAHCKRGADRTGTMIAAYRVAVEHKSVEEAVSEMHQFHYAAFFLPQLERYVKTLPNLLKTAPQFSAYAPSANPVPAAIGSVAAVAIPVIQ